MKPNLDRLSDGQKKLWPELSETPDDFTLFCGVALTIRFGHRPTSGFDFYCRKDFDAESLYETLSFLKGTEVSQLSTNTLVCQVHRGEPVKVSFFGLPDFGFVAEPEIVEGPAIKVSSLLELAGIKTSIVQKRAVARDYIDLDMILTKGGVSLTDALLAGRQLYGRLFHPQVALQALRFFGDGDLNELPEDVRTRLSEASAQVELEKLKE